MDTRLKTSAEQIREEQRIKKDKKDKFEMGLKQTNLSNSNFDRSSATIQDTKMSSLLEKVRNSSTTLNQDYARFTGTSLYNPSEQENNITKKKAVGNKKVKSETKPKKKKIVAINSNRVSKTIDTIEKEIIKELRFGVKERSIPKSSNLFGLNLNENLLHKLKDYK